MSAVMDTFASLLQFLSKHGRTDLACQLRKDGIRSMAQARSVAPACIAHLLQLEDGRVAEDSFEATSIVARSNPTVPPVVPTMNAFLSDSRNLNVKGSLSDALAVTTDPALRKRALLNFENDKYAGTSMGPRNSMWNTWCRICKAWQISPLPLTPDLRCCFFEVWQIQISRQLFQPCTARTHLCHGHSTDRSGGTSIQTGHFVLRTQLGRRRH